MAREMKDSGIEWIGEIPADWNVVKVKKVVKSIDNGVWGDDPIPGIETYKVLRSTEQTVDGQWNISVPAERDLSSIPSLSKYAVQENDLLITKSSGSNDHIGKTTLVTQEIAKQNFFYSNFLGRIRVSERYSSKLLWYILNSSVARSQFVYLQNSTSGLGNINGEMIGNLWLPMMSLTNQNHIASFLDSKCAEIDKAVEATKASIEEYRKLKQTIITETVTKGLDPNVEMKDSGIEWIGEIPLKYIASCNDEVLSEDTNPDTQFEYIEIGDVSYEQGITGSKLLSFKDAPSRARRIVKKDDIIVSTVRTYLKAVASIPKKYEGQIVSTGFAVIRPKNIDSRFLMYCLLADNFVSEIESRSTGVSYPAINSSDVMRIKIKVPTNAWQTLIASYLDTKCSEIDSLIKSKEKLIEELTAYRKAMIYEYVTGKKEVPVEPA